MLNFCLKRCFGLLALPATASDDYQWQQLNSQQQRILKQYENRWQDLTMDRREKFAAGAQTWIDMSPQQRKKYLKKS